MNYESFKEILCKIDSTASVSLKNGVVLLNCLSGKCWYKFNVDRTDIFKEILKSIETYK